MHKAGVRSDRPGAGGGLGPEKSGRSVKEALRAAKKVPYIQIRRKDDHAG